MKLYRWRRLWQVLVVADAREESEVLHLLDESNRDGRNAMRALLSRNVLQYGPPRDDQTSRHLGDGIWEFRKDRVRILWFYDEKKVVIATNGFLKRTGKTPPSQKEKAVKLRSEYRLAKQAGNIEIVDL